MTLSAVSLAYYRHIIPNEIPKFARYAQAVWNVNPAGKTDAEIAQAGLTEMEKWMREMSLVLHIKELGVTEDMIEGLADGTVILKGGYKVLTKD